MAFTISEEADPLLQQISFLLKPLSGIESRLSAAIDGLGKLTTDAAAFQAAQTFAALERLTGEFESQGNLRADEASNIIDAIIQNARIDFGTVTDRIDVAAEDMRVAALRQAEITRREIDQAAAITAAAVATQTEETNKALGLLGDITGNAIRALPGGIGIALTPIINAFQEALASGDAALGDGFGFLGASNLLGFAAIGDILSSMFNIDPEQFAQGFAGMMPFMAEIAKNAGDDILAVGE